MTIFVHYPECSCAPDSEVVNVITEMPPPLLVGLDLASSRPILESVGIASVGRRGSFDQLLTKDTPVSSTHTHNQNLVL